MRWVVNATPRPLYPRESDPVPFVQEAGWGPGPVWTGVENLAPTDIRSPDHPARSESPHRLSYPGHTSLTVYLHYPPTQTAATCPSTLTAASVSVNVLGRLVTARNGEQSYLRGTNYVNKQFLD